MINCNPETVSTDYDTSRPAVLRAAHQGGRAQRDRRRDAAAGGVPPKVIVSLGGQTPLKLAGQIPAELVAGTSPESIDAAEDREKWNAAVRRAAHPAAARRHGHRPRTGAGDRRRRSASRCSCARATCSAAGRCRSSTTATTSPRAMAELAGFGSLGKEGGLSAERPVLIDRFLADATEVDVDAIRDHTGEVLIGGVMEHVEEAGVHSGDSACAIPPQTLPSWVVEVIEAYTAAIAKRLDVRGLINVQYAVRRHDGVRDRGQPAGQPHGAVRRQGDRRAAGQGGDPGDARRDARRAARRGPAAAVDLAADGHVAVKEAVLPFSRFPEVDPALGPEMRSTGEVMGIDTHVRPGVLQGRAGGRHRAADRRARCSCRSPTPTSRPGWWSPSGCASSGSASSPPRAPPPTSPGSAQPVDQVRRQGVSEGAGNDGRRPDRRRARSASSSTPRRVAAAAADGEQIRKAASLHRVSCVTTVDAALAAVQGMAERGEQLTVRALQEYHALQEHRRVRRRRTSGTASDGAGRLGAAGQPGDDRVGHRRLRHRAGRLLRPRRARRGRRQVARRLRVGRQPGAAAAPDAAGHAQRRRPAGARRRALARARAARPAAHRARPSSPASGVARSTSTARGRRTARRRPGRGRRRRGQPVVPQPRGSARDLRPRPRAVGRGDRGDAGLRAAAMGEAERQHRPHRRRRRRGPRRRRRGGDVHQHDARHGATTRTRGGRRSAPAAEGCRAGRSTRSPCAPSTTCTPPCPTCRSSASAAWRRAGTPPS